METGESSLSRKEETGYSEFFFLVDDANYSLFMLIAMQRQGTSDLGFVPNITFYTGKWNKSSRFWQGLKLVV